MLNKILKKQDKEAVETLLCDELNFSAAEAYKLLRTNLLFALPDEGKCRVIGLTSSIRGEGKSTTSINLSHAIAATGKRVLLIDGDLRLPTVAKKLGISSEYGLSDAIAGIANVKDLMLTVKGIENWHIITAGSIPPNPTEMLGSQRMNNIIDDLSNSYDFIIIDLPPVNVVSDALVVSTLLDGMIIVVRSGYSKRREVAKCMKHIEMSRVKVLGIVLSSVHQSGKYYYHYGEQVYSKRG